jgi:hypothetical protein
MQKTICFYIFCADPCAHISHIGTVVDFYNPLARCYLRRISGNQTVKLELSL